MPTRAPHSLLTPALLLIRPLIMTSPSTAMISRLVPVAVSVEVCGIVSDCTWTTVTVEPSLCVCETDAGAFPLSSGPVRSSDGAAVASVHGL